MRATWRPMPTWSHPPRRHLNGSRFRSSWGDALELLESEIALLEGFDVLIGFVGTEDQVNFSGNLKRGGQTRFDYHGIEVSFSVEGRGRMVFQTDAFDDVGQNLRAIGLGMQALRTVERYGITSSNEQYAGFLQLAAGGADVDRGRELVTLAGSPKAALFRHHPDRAGGDARDFMDVKAYLDSQGAAT